MDIKIQSDNYKYLMKKMINLQKILKILLNKIIKEIKNFNNLQVLEFQELKMLLMDYQKISRNME